MYSENIQKILESNNIEIGDKIEINDKEGYLMPKPETGDPEIINLKLDSGYNVGLKPESIKLIEKHKSVDETREKSIENKENSSNILILHTGGTIASRISYETGGVKASFEQEDMVEMYPEIMKEANIDSEVYVGKIMSEDMEPGHWKGIAKKIDNLKDEYDGIIVGHGTDTLSSTGAALSLMLKGIDIGVLLVGSQRSSDRPSTDARMNLYCATKFLSETEFTGIGVCMHNSVNDEICNILPGAKTRKMHTSRRDAFKTVNTSKIGSVNYQTGDINFDGSTQEGKKYDPSFELSEEVGFLKVRPGLKPSKIQYYIDQGYEGIVIEGTGLGHMPISVFDEETEHHKEIQEKLENLTEQALVVMSSNCLNGRVNMDVYDNQVKVKKRGVIESEDMHPELAYVKLMWSLGQTDEKSKAKELFQTNINREMSERSEYNGD